MKYIIFLLDYLNFKTFRINFRKLPFRQAIKFPILISRYSRLRDISGHITITGDIHTGMIRFGGDRILDGKRPRCMLNLRKGAELVFEGRAFFGPGTHIAVQGGGNLRFGNNVNITSNTTITVVNSIKIGEDCLLAWDILIMDTDWHSILDKSNNIINSPATVSIGNHCWICCRSMILKGVNIADGCIIAAGTTVTRSVTQKNCIVAKNPQQIIRRDISWTHEAPR